MPKNFASPIGVEDGEYVSEGEATDKEETGEGVGDSVAVGVSVGVCVGEF
jgi:hypothetical protein